MKHIGIITHYDVFNHGAILQLNALCKTLRAKGYDAKALQFEKNYDFLGVKLKSKYNISIKSVVFYIKYLCKKGMGKTIFNVRKMRLLNKFKQQEQLLDAYYTECGKKDAVIIGSDEVFALHTGPTPVFFGHACPSDHVISYAGCFGPTTLNDIRQLHCEALVKSGLQSMEAVSVRDKNSFDIVTELTGKEPTLVCDPVILYGYRQELARFTPPSLPKYMVVYAYDESLNDPEEVKQIKDYARRNNLIIVSPGFYHSWCDKNINVDSVNIINYFAHAACVVTDTFHGTVLSIITGREVAVKIRNNSNKLLNLIHEYHLEQQTVSSFDQLDRAFSKPIDYQSVNQEIEKWRKASMEFLDKALRNI